MFVFIFHLSSCYSFSLSSFFPPLSFPDLSSTAPSPQPPSPFNVIIICQLIQGVGTDASRSSVARCSVPSTWRVVGAQFVSTNCWTACPCCFGLSTCPGSTSLGPSGSTPQSFKSGVNSLHWEPWVVHLAKVKSFHRIFWKDEVT